MGVPSGCLHLCVTKQFSDHGKTFAKGESPAGKAMAKVMNSHIGQLGPRPDAPPWVLKIGEVGPGHLASDHPGVLLVTGEIRQKPHG